MTNENHALIKVKIEQLTDYFDVNKIKYNRKDASIFAKELGKNLASPKNNNILARKGVFTLD
jgi:hypothetical protein